MRSCPPNEITLQALTDQRRRPVVDPRTPIDYNDNIRYALLQIIPEDVKKILRTFYLGSSGGPDGILDTVARNTAELYRFKLVTYVCEPGFFSKAIII